MSDEEHDKLEHETAYWADCANTYSEETKQMAYASVMGITKAPGPGKTVGYWWRHDLEGKSVLDIGGGPVSLLLKSENGGRMDVIDPAPYPTWVWQRYKAHGVNLFQMRAEDFEPKFKYDECWIYNVLQHVDSPGQVIATAQEASDTLRIFEWVNVPGDKMHPHVLTIEALRGWLGGGELDLRVYPGLNNWYSSAEVPTTGVAGVWTR